MGHRRGDKDAAIVRGPSTAPAVMNNPAGTGSLDSTAAGRCSEETLRECYV